MTISFSPCGRRIAKLGTPAFAGVPSGAWMRGAALQRRASLRFALLTLPLGFAERAPPSPTRGEGKEK
jgi:hypothetical protein